MDFLGEPGVAALLPFPVSVEPGVFREGAERSAGRPPMGQKWNGGKITGWACKESAFK